MPVHDSEGTDVGSDYPERPYALVYDVELPPSERYMFSGGDVTTEPVTMDGCRNGNLEPFEPGYPVWSINQLVQTVIEIIRSIPATPPSLPSTGRRNWSR